MRVRNPLALVISVAGLFGLVRHRRPWVPPRGAGVCGGGLQRRSTGSAFPDMGFGSERGRRR